ncbi:MAG: hypothetical protein Q7R88_02935 [bacterium]|nr:hypothetical protein [bacterium]
MKKSNIAIGLLSAAVIVLGVTLLRGGALPSDGTDITAAAGQAQKTVVVTYTDYGFKPPVVKINRGDSVQFVNDSGKAALRVVPLTDKSFNENAYPGLAASKSIRRGENFAVSFTLPGVWGFTNANAATMVGVVIVE